jgi:hypothetical protein
MSRFSEEVADSLNATEKGSNSVSDVDFLGLGSEEKLCPIFGRTHRRLDCVIW